MKVRANWLVRHQNNWNFLLHMFGIPMSLLVAPILAAQGVYPPAIGCFVGGYLLQWIGHRIEGNDVGELIPIKRLLGLPTVAIAPQFQTSLPS
jgi:uncharacterized membrane protein YGL010W